MNPFCSSLTHPDGGAGADARRDLHRRDIVDDAIALIGVSGTLSALEYLKSHAIAGGVIARVLLDPGRRRAAASLAAA